MKIEKQIFDFKFETKEFEEKTINGLKIGVIKGWASTYNNIDKTLDIVQEGAFAETIEVQKGTTLKMLKNHKREDILGGFPINLMKDAKEGLFVVGHINLEVNKGRETYALAKQGVINKMSIGFRIKNYDKDTDFIDGIRILKKVELREISIVYGTPANDKATITQVKSIEEATELKDIETFLKEKGLSQKECRGVISKVNSLKDKDVDEKKNKLQCDVEEEEKQCDVAQKKNLKISKEIKGLLLDYLNKTGK